MIDKCRVCGLDADGDFFNVYYGGPIFEGQQYARGVVLAHMIRIPGGGLSTSWTCVEGKQSIFICKQCLEKESRAHKEAKSKVKDSELGAMIALEIKKNEEKGGRRWYLPSLFEGDIIEKPEHIKKRIGLIIETPEELLNDEWIGQRLQKRLQNKCFVATAAFGSPMAWEVETLRFFRNEYLQKNKVGQVLMNIYNNIGPYLAEIICKYELAQMITKKVINCICNLLILLDITPKRRQVFAISKTLDNVEKS